MEPSARRPRQRAIGQPIACWRQYLERGTVAGALNSRNGCAALPVFCYRAHRTCSPMTPPLIWSTAHSEVRRWPSPAWSRLSCGLLTASRCRSWGASGEQMEKELRALLTPEQTKILDEMKAHRPPMPPGGPMPAGEGPPPGDHGFCLRQAVARRRGRQDPRRRHRRRLANCQANRESLCRQSSSARNTNPR